MDISVQYQMSQKEVGRAMFAIAPMRQAAVYAIFVLVPAAIDTSGFSRLRAVDVVALLIIEAVMVAILVRGRRKQTSRLAVPSALTLTAQSVTLALPTSSVTHQWTTFVRLASAKDFWLFYTTKQCAMIIPKRAFDADQRREIEAFVGSASGAGGVSVSGQYT